MTGSSAFVSGCISTPGFPSRPARSSSEGNCVKLPSPSRRSMGDQPAMLPAITPAMAAAGPNAELDRERERRPIDLRSGVGGAGARLPESPRVLEGSFVGV